MKFIKSNKLFSWFMEQKILLFIVAISFVALVLPGAYVCASEIATDEAQQAAVSATEEQATPATETEASDEGVIVVTGEDETAIEEVVPSKETDEGVVIVTGDDQEGATEDAPEAEVDNKTVTVTGTVKDANGSAIPAEKNPYVQIALLDPLGEEFEQEVDVVEGEFKIENVPSETLLNYGIITAGADDFANEILSYPGTVSSTVFNFVLKPGINCSFENEEEKLDDYCLCTGSYMQTSNGTRIEIPFLFGDISLGAGLPSLGLPAGGKITESITNGTLIYQYKNADSKEEFYFIFSAHPESGYQFNYWTINDEPISDEGYLIDSQTDITIKPIFTERGKMIVGGIVKDKSTGKVIEGAYGYIIGFDITSGEMYYSKMKETDEDGIFIFEDVPDGLKGVIVGGAPGHTTQPQYLSYYVPRTEFNLNPGVVCAIDPPEELSTVLIEAGSKIKIDGYDEIILPFAVDLGNDFPPLGFPKDGEMVFKEKGVVEYKFTHDDPEHSVKSLDLILKAYPKTGFAFKNWLLNGEEFSGKLQLSTVKDDFTIKPVYRNAGPYKFSTYIQNHDKEPIANAYAYLVGMHESTGEVYLSDTVTTDSEGVFAIENIPYDVSGIVVVGAPGYVNRFDYCDCDVDATFFTLDEGVQISIQTPETVSTVYIEKGTSIKLTVEGIPLEFALPYDVDFGNFFLPFGITPDGTFNFMEDGRLSFTYSKPSNAVNIQSFNLITKVVPKEGYVFTGWLKDGQAISGEYTLQTGEKDFSITPVFESSVTPEPTPVTPVVVNPTGTPQTLDGLDMLIVLLYLGCAFGLVFAIRRYVFNN